MTGEGWHPVSLSSQWVSDSSAKQGQKRGAGGCGEEGQLLRRWVVRLPVEGAPCGSRRGRLPGTFRSKTPCSSRTGPRTLPHSSRPLREELISGRVGQPWAADLRHTCVGWRLGSRGGGRVRRFQVPRPQPRPQPPGRRSAWGGGRRGRGGTGRLSRGQEAGCDRVAAPPRAGWGWRSPPRAPLGAVPGRQEARVGCGNPARDQPPPRAALSHREALGGT